MLVDLPFKAEDLSPGERYYRRKEVHGSGSQALGYDLTAVRLDRGTGKWTSRVAGGDGTKNDDSVAYGKPVYAMSDGTVIKGWRNAPENPGPGQTHPRRGNGIGGGGNHLVVELADGSLILYAHLQPGTIPRRLVPHDEEFTTTDDARNIPVAQQATVKAGDFLGLVGNSGKSSGPHLHVHRVKDGRAGELRFRRGLATKLTDRRADIDKWVRFAGKPIPAGPVLIWPPRSLGTEYSRHGFPVGGFRRMFDHLADSGYAPRWIDGYNVGGKAYLNFVWTPATGPWRAYHGLSSRAYQERFTAAVDAGYQPVFVESYLSRRKVRYIAIFDKSATGAFRARHGLTDEQHAAEFDVAKSAGLKPDCVSVVSIRGSRRYTVLYRSEGIGSWQLKSRVKEGDYQDVFEANKAAGRRPIYLQAYKHGGTTFLSTIFASGVPGSIRARHGMTGAQYQAQFDANTGAGFTTTVVTAVDGAKTKHRFAAVWTKK